MADNSIQQITGFRTKDGQQFFTLAEAQEHTRRSLLSLTFDRACTNDPRFHQLPKELFLDFMMKFGTAFARISTDPLKPLRPADVTMQEAEEASEAELQRGGERQVSKNPVLGMPYGARPAGPETVPKLVANRKAAEEADARKGGLYETIFGMKRPDPLKSAMHAVDEAELEAAMAADLDKMPSRTAQG